MNRLKINLYDLLKIFGGALDLAAPQLSNHHRQVAYMSVTLAKELGVSDAKTKDLLLGSCIHDIGALSSDERIDIVEREALNINHHAFIGAKLISVFQPLETAANMLKFHHIPWGNGAGATYKGLEVPFESHIMHLADRVCTKIKQPYAAADRAQVIEWAKAKSGELFIPETVNAFENFLSRESVWLDLMTNNLDEGFEDIAGNTKLNLEEVKNLAFIISKIIDFRSNFTARHSAGVAASARAIAELVGFSKTECDMMLIAGYLHDLGKLAISDAILEKRGKLDQPEMALMRAHTYYTYRLLSLVSEFGNIKEWAAYHHERLDGKGYPFEVGADNLSIGSRIMAVADVYTAIKEDRPYRASMSDSDAKAILKNMASGGALDKKVVDLLFENFEFVEKFRIMGQDVQYKQYEDFLKVSTEVKTNVNTGG